MTGSSVGYCGRLEAGRVPRVLGNTQRYSCWGLLSAAALVFTPSPTVPSQYQLGTVGSNNCPDRYDRITALSVCEAAAASQGKPFGGSEWDSQYPNGCYMLGSVYLNTYGFGGNVFAYPYYQLLCASGAAHARARVHA